MIRKEFLEYIRTKKFLILVVVLLFIALSSPITAKLLPYIFESIDLQGIKITIPDPTYIDAVDQYIKNLSQIGIFVIIFLVSGSIADEKTNKTFEILLTKPLSRAHIIIAKFASWFIALTSTVIATAGIFYFYSVSLFEAFDLMHFSIITGLMLVYILTVASVTLLASTFSKHSLAAAGIGIIFFLFAGPLFGIVDALTPYSPASIVGEYRTIQASGFSVELVKPLISSALIIMGSFFCAISAFRNMEIDR